MDPSVSRSEGETWVYSQAWSYNKEDKRVIWSKQEKRRGQQRQGGEIGGVWKWRVASCSGWTKPCNNHRDDHAL